MSLQPTSLEPEDEYAVLEPSASWSVASLACFLAALGARFLVRLLPADLVGYPWTILLPAVTVPAASLLGIVFGLVGLRAEHGRGLARLGILVNSVGLVLGLLAIAAFFYILRR